VAHELFEVFVVGQEPGARGSWDREVAVSVRKTDRTATPASIIARDDRQHT